MIKTSSSRTDWEILTLTSPFENLETVQGVRGVPSLRACPWTAQVAHRENCISPLGHSSGELRMAVSFGCGFNGEE
jgi:hypothetical protein